MSDLALQKKFNDEQINEQFIWLAGLLEGEGCFRIHTSQTGRTSEVALSMADEDIVRRAALLMCGNVTVDDRHNPRHQPMFRCRVYGKKARKVCRHVLPYMGIRRYERIRELLEMGRKYMENPYE